MEPRAGVSEAFLKPFNPEVEEAAAIKLWDTSGYTNPDKCVADGITEPDAEPYTIVLPPPNVTGTLHMGHAAMLAIEDILVRYARMQGKRTLWVPGTDSAAIATQSKVEGEIYKKEKKTRYDIGRDELMTRIEAFTEESKNIIINQVRTLGASLDWSRYAYTMDEPRYNAVMTAFVRMFEAGLIYRGNRIVNWDPNLQTTVSDDEIEYVEKKDPFYYFQYGPFVIGTVRPETKFGDKYVVMHPKDERYKEYTHGQTIDLEWINGPITATVIKDEAAQIDVGSGVMTITPAHSNIDFEIAQRHNLDVEQVISERGILLSIAGEFEGQHIKKARAAIVEKLKAKGLVAKVDEGYVHNVATNSRGGGTIEPQIKKQWFVAVNKKAVFPDGKESTLKEWMREAVESGQTKIHPERFERIYYHWIDNLRDWCISRQIWFGHRIPVWYKRTLGGPHQSTHFNYASFLRKLGITEQEFRAKTFEWQDLPDYAIMGGSPNIQIGMRLMQTLKERDLITDQWVKENAIEQPVYLDEQIHCSVTGPENDMGWERDPDTLDTWFSSGLWTFSTLGWPHNPVDLKTYHPTSVLETGYDILFFWVARMILMSGFLVGQVPFKQVYLHGLVRDGQGRKMSKSLGNIIDPLDMVKKYGADATRLSLIIGAQPGNDLKLSEDRVRGYKHFANKLWNISRFVLESCSERNIEVELNTEDAALVEEAKAVVKSASENMDAFRLDLAADSLYHFVWDRFAAQILEESKPVFMGGNENAKNSRARALYEILSMSLKSLHPFMPFVTEAIWQKLPKKDADILMVAKWPTSHVS